LDYVDVPAPASAYVVPAAAFNGEFVDKVITAESSGNAKARPCDAKTGKLLSSAYGAGQFIEATWLEMIRSTGRTSRPKATRTFSICAATSRCRGK
jgi:hypothetical protein